MSEDAMERAVQQAPGSRGSRRRGAGGGPVQPARARRLDVRRRSGGGRGRRAGGSVGEAVGEITGVAGGMRANAAGSGMPQWMLVGVTADAVYGFDGRSRSKEPGKLVFKAVRAGLGVQVHQRVNVRVLELIHPESGSRIELEGSRVSVTHSKDVIAALTGD